MRRVVSVSLGSSLRDKVAEAEFLGERFRLERMGTDGDLRRAISTIRELDGQVDCIGLGGIDLYLVAGGRKYAIRDAARMAQAAKRTPVVDGSGLKHTLERQTIEYLSEQKVIDFAGKKVLVVSAVDRFGMAETFPKLGCRMIYGDLIFALGLPLPLRSMRAVRILARLLLPVICQLPFEMIYPTGGKQEVTTTKYEKYFRWADIIAGDFHYIKRYMPPQLPGKMVITNTLTESDVELLKARGVAMLVSTTPEIEGRSFATNVMEGILVACSAKPEGQLQPQDYLELLGRMNWQPRIVKMGSD